MDPFPTIGNLSEAFGTNSDVARNITTVTKLADFNAFLRDCNVASAGEITEAQKLAEAIRVGTDAKSITSPATITAQSGEIGNPLTFTIAKPGEKSGFVKLLIAR